MSTATIPQQLYVTVQFRKDVKSESGKLGFMGPYERNAAFRKRKERQDEWAYGYGVEFVIDENDKIYAGPNNKVDVTEFFATKCYPKIYDNTPLDGFKIADSVRRSTWNGTSVAWRIEDPRGYEIEINSENFAKVIDCTTLVNGVIQDKCVWGRIGSQNVLLPVNSEPYINANTTDQLKANRIQINKVPIGSRVLVVDKKEEQGSYEAIYCGKVMVVNSDTDYSNGVTTYRCGNLQQRFCVLKDDQPVYVSKLDIGKILDESTARPQSEIIAQINKCLDGDTTVTSYHNYMVAGVNDKLSVKYKDCDINETIKYLDSTRDITEVKDKRFYVFECAEGNFLASTNPTGVILKKINILDPDSLDFTFVTETRKASGRYRSVAEVIIRSLSEVSIVSVKRPVITLNDTELNNFPLLFKYLVNR